MPQVDAMASYRLPSKIENEIQSELANSGLKQLAIDYQRELSNNDIERAQEMRSIRTRLEALSPAQVKAFKRLTRDRSFSSDSDKIARKREILQAKFESDSVDAIERRYGAGSTQYNTQINFEDEMKSNRDLIDLAEKVVQPSLVSDNAFGVDAQAWTTFCGYDTSWPRSMNVTTWYIPYALYYPTYSADVRNGWSDVICDYKVYTPNHNMTHVLGRNYQGHDAIDCYSSMIARNNRDEILGGSFCASGAGVWSHWTMRNLLVFRKG